MAQNKPRKPWLAVLLSILLVGLGHIYSGKVKRGLFLYLFQAVILSLAVSIIVFYTNAFTFIFVSIAMLTYFICCVVDAFKTAKLGKDSYTVKKYNKWYVYLFCYILSVFFISPAVSNLIKENAIKAYKIPSGAMVPTFLIGDHIIVNSFIYKSHSPTVGDIIVFEYPKNPELDYIKRVVAKGGDNIAIIDKKLIINGIEQNESYAKHYDSKILNKEIGPRDNFGPISVPNNSVFVMGDNRDNSFDSRFWGYVRLDQIKGKAISIYWSWDPEGKKVRWERIGKNIE